MTEELAENELLRLERLCEAATPGPLTLFATERSMLGTGAIMAPRRMLYHIGTADDDEAVVNKGGVSRDNGRLFVESRTAIPRLIAAYRSMKAERDWLKAQQRPKELEEFVRKFGEEMSGVLDGEVLE